jgi:hypothetical protein
VDYLTEQETARITALPVDVVPQIAEAGIAKHIDAMKGFCD